MWGGLKPAPNLLWMCYAASTTIFAISFSVIVFHRPLRSRRKVRREKICFLFCWETRKEKIYTVMTVRIIAVHIRTRFWIKWLYRVRLVAICFPSSQRKTNQIVNSASSAPLRWALFCQRPFQNHHSNRPFWEWRLNSGQTYCAQKSGWGSLKKPFIIWQKCDKGTIL